MPNPDSPVSGTAYPSPLPPGGARVSILIVNWNTRALLSACLDSIVATVPASMREIIIVDNGSTDDTVEWLRAQPLEITLIANSQNVGFARANNQALKRCTGDFALLLNSDAQLLEYTLDRLVAVMQQEPHAAAVGPMLLNRDETFQAGPNDDLTLWNEALLTLGLARYLRSGHYPGLVADAPRGIYAWVGGTCLLMRRAAWEQIGLLDADYFFYTEEADWCWRARQAGWTIWYEPSARAVHLGGGSSRLARGQMPAELYKSKLLFFQKHRPRWQALFLRYLVLVSASAKAAGYGLAARFNAMRASAWRERAISFRMVVDAVKTVAT